MSFKDKQTKKEYMRNYYLKNKDKIIDNNKKWRHNNKDYINKYQYNYTKNWRRNNGLKTKFHYYKNNAKRRNLEFELTFSEFIDLVSKNCYYCGEIGGGIDRKDNNKGYTLNNSVPCCYMCNLMKFNFNIKNFIRKCKLVTENNK